MAGTKAGAKKAAETSRSRYGANHHAEIAKRSWDNPDRSREVGFAKLDKETVIELAKKGGSKTKNDYKKEKGTVNTETEEVSTGTL